MPRMILYADESGTMPLQDNDGPFVAAIVAVRAPLLMPTRLRPGIRALFAQAAAARAVPFFAYVLPVPGYGAAVQKKYDKLNLMTRARGLLERRSVLRWISRTTFSELVRFVMAHSFRGMIIPRSVH